MDMAIAGEVICGLAYGSQPLLYAVVSEILPRRYRPAAQGGINASLGAGGIVALLAGSGMVKDYNEGFRVFWYMVAASLAIASIVCAIFYNPPARPLQSNLSTSEKMKQLDWIAYALLALAVILFVMGLSWAENPYPWKDAHVLAPLLIGAMFGIVLVIHQTIFKKDGLFHHDLFKGDRNFAIALFIMFVDGAAFFAVNGYFSFEVSVLYETDVLRVGLRFCIVFFASVFSSLLIAVYASYTKNVRYPIVVSFALFVVFFGTLPALLSLYFSSSLLQACIATATTGSSTAAWVYPIIIGLGIGCSLTCLVTIAQLSTPPALIAITSGLIIAVRSLGGSVGLAICKYCTLPPEAGTNRPRLVQILQSLTRPSRRTFRLTSQLKSSHLAYRLHLSRDSSVLLLQMTRKLL